ncbi:MAG: hypothetical protein ACO25K_06040 [Candidatus Fonsibacter ubiquis]|jgi:hypothetical protein
MELIRPLGDIPLISIKNFFIIEEENKQKLIPHLLKNKKEHDETVSGADTYSFLLEYDSYGILKSLYEQFFSLCSHIFGPFTLSEDHTDRLCGLMTNNNYWAFNPHHHIRTSTINGVYYLNIPKIEDEYCGRFMVQWNGSWHSYQPEPNELIIMPNFLVHDISHHDSSEWRISINMEIMTNETLKELVNN